MGKDPKTPDWVQHISFRLEDEAALMEAKAQLEANGIDVVGPTNHEIIKSIYFFDPNGHRLELTTVTATQEMLDNLHDIAPTMLEEWTKTKKTLPHAAWLHEKEFKE